MFSELNKWIEMRNLFVGPLLKLRQLQSNFVSINWLSFHIPQVIFTVIRLWNFPSHVVKISVMISIFIYIYIYIAFDRGCARVYIAFRIRVATSFLMNLVSLNAKFDRNPCSGLTVNAKQTGRQGYSCNCYISMNSIDSSVNVYDPKVYLNRLSGNLELCVYEFLSDCVI